MLRNRIAWTSGAMVAAIFAGGALADVTITDGTLDLFTNGTVGRRGSTTGLITDDPTVIHATSGVLTQSAHVEGGPVPAGDLPSFPGTLARFAANSDGYAEIFGDAGGMIITQNMSVSNGFFDMDGAELSGATGASGVSRIFFTLTAPTPYRLEGVAAFDDEDAAGFIRMGTALVATRFVNRSTNGPFSFSGTLAAGSYNLHTTINVSASVGGAGVGNGGDFAESGAAFAVLTLGTPPAPCDPDVNQDGNADQGDIDYLINVVAGGNNDTGIDPDFNHDGNVDQGDVDALINVVAGGQCP